MFFIKVYSMSDTNEIKMYNPPLVAMLLRAEELKKASLKESEVIKIMNTAPFIMVPKDVAKKTAEQRGYEDVDINDVWNSWQSIKSQLEKNE